MCLCLHALREVDMHVIHADTVHSSDRRTPIAVHNGRRGAMEMVWQRWLIMSITTQRRMEQGKMYKYRL